MTSWDPLSMAQNVIRCTLCENATADLCCTECSVDLCGSCVAKHFISNTAKRHVVVPLFQSKRSSTLKSVLFALRTGAYISRRSRLMIVGHKGVGKTTLTGGLVGRKVGSDVESTDGIDLLRAHVIVHGDNEKWEVIQRLEGEQQKLNEALAMTVQYPYRKTKGNTSDTNVDEFFLLDTDLKGFRQTFFEKLSAIDRKPVRVEIGNILIDIWDFAGQSVFYTTHQSFLTPRSLYIIVLNLSKELGSVVDDIGFDTQAQSTVIEYLDFWVTAITFYARGTTSGFPKMLLVGTHMDQVDHPAKKIQSLMYTVKERYSDLVDNKQLVINEKLFFNAQDLDDKGYCTLREIVLLESKTYPHWEEPYPSSWLHLQDMIMSERDKGREIIPLEEILRLNHQSSVTPLPDEQVELLLEVQHEFGNIIYFNHKELKSVVVLDPNLLIKALRLFVTAKEFIKCNKSNAEIWKNLSVCGVISEKDLKYLWKVGKLFTTKDHHDRDDDDNDADNDDDGDKDTVDGRLQLTEKHYSEHLIKLFQKMDVIVQPKMYRDGEEDSSNILFVPCMVTEQSGSREIDDFLKSNESLSQYFYIGVEDTIVPPAIGYKLLAFCVSSWPVMRKRLHLRCGVFRLDLFHLLIVKISLTVLEVYIVHKRSKKAISSNVALCVKESLCAFLNRTISTYTDHFKIKTNFYQDSDVLKKECCTFECKGLPEECLLKKMQELDLARLGRVIPESDNLYTIGVSLGVKDNFIDNIKADQRYFADRMFFVLRAWKNSSTNGTFHEMQLALQKMEIDTHILCDIYNPKEFDDRCSEIPSEILQDAPKQEQMDQVSNLIGKEFFQFGLELGLPSTFIEQTIHENKGNIPGCIRKLLLRWRSSENKPTVRALASAVYQCTLDFSAFAHIFKPCKKEDSWELDW